MKGGMRERYMTPGFRLETIVAGFCVCVVLGDGESGFVDTVALIGEVFDGCLTEPLSDPVTALSSPDAGLIFRRLELRESRPAFLLSARSFSSYLSYPESSDSSISRKSFLFLVGILVSGSAVSLPRNDVMK